MTQAMPNPNPHNRKTPVTPFAAPAAGTVVELYRALRAAIAARDEAGRRHQAVHDEVYGTARPAGDYWDAAARRAARQALDAAFSAAGGPALFHELDRAGAAVDRLQRAMAGMPAASLADALLKLRVAVWEHGQDHGHVDPIVTGAVDALADLERLVHVDEPPLREYDAAD